MKKLLVVVIAVAGLFLAAAPAVNAEYIANFDADMEGWTGGGEYWGSTGGQDGGYFGAVRTKYGPYLTPPDTCSLYGDLGANLGGNLVTYSFYLKDIGGTGGLVDQFLVWGGGTILRYNHPDTTSPTDWTNYTIEVDIAAGEAPDNWTMDDPGVGWANAWKSVTYYNFWSSPSTGSGTVNDHGIDTVRVTAIPEPSIVVLLLGLAGLACLVRPARR